jgi:hypothetical protein
MAAVATSEHAARWLARDAAGGGSDLERAGHPLGGDRAAVALATNSAAQSARSGWGLATTRARRGAARIRRRSRVGV